MLSNTIIFREYSLPPEALMPDEAFTDADVERLAFLEAASQVNPVTVKTMVLEDLADDDSPLREFILDAIREPYEDLEHPRVNIIEMAKLGTALVKMMARHIADLANLRAIVESEVR